MDLNKSKILIEKINSLHKSMGGDASHIAAIEKDLMLSYIRQLYEVVLSDTPATNKAASKVEIIKSTPKPKPIKKFTPAPKPVEREIMVPDEVEEIEAPIVSSPKPIRKAPRVIEVSEVLSEYTAAAPTRTPRPEPLPTLSAPVPTYAGDDDMEELFEYGSARELSEKLSNLPIRDLRKAMGLNEKIFTMNELFGGSQPDYDNAMGELNGMRNFEEAKAYLIQNIAKKYDWTKRSKKKKAQNFIKLVRRRYA
ncbi:MAG: hypothetical protein ACI9XO_002113 [Paraglaciecola sp.]|jgi:hypothetical protein